MKTRQFLLCFTFLICLTLTGFHFAKASRSSYGESCSKTQKCDRKAWLSCYDGLCDCSKPEEMLFDPEKGKCVTKSGERCKYGVEESGESSLLEITECIQHANCGADGICNCDSQYHEIFNGTCAKSKSFGENCNDEDKCSKFEQLDCVEETCQCKEGASIYSSEEMQCVGLLNKSCASNKCENKTECKNGKCVCDEDHYEDSGRCLLRKGALESCTKHSECIHKGLYVLKCFENICDCEEGTVLAKVQKTKYATQYQHHYYKGGSYYYQFQLEGPFTNLCAPLAGKNCTSGYCSPNAYCLVPNDKRQDSDKFKYGKCDCLEGYSLNEGKTQCGKNRGQTCATYQDCFNDFVCDEGVCKCASPVSQVAQSSYCTTLDGGECSSTTQCAKNALCEFLPDSGNKVGHCRCSDGYVKNIEGTCDIGFGKSCSYKDHRLAYNRENCDRAAELTCLNRICSCPDKMSEFSVTMRRCLRKVGAFCSDTKPCVENAVCFNYHPSLTPECICPLGFEETTNLTCVARTIINE